MGNNDTNGEFFEIQKNELEEFNDYEKKTKAGLLRRNIALGVLSVISTTVFTMTGMNPFVAFAATCTLPIGLFVVTDLKILSNLKKQRAEIEGKQDRGAHL